MYKIEEKLAELESFVGAIGEFDEVGTPKFRSIADLLEETAILVDEEDSIGPFTDFIEETYEAKLGGLKFRLWYEVRRPDTPRMVLKYGFEKVDQS